MHIIFPTAVISALQSRAPFFLVEDIISVIILCIFSAVKKFLKTSPHRAQVSPGDKIALLQLDRGTMQVSLEQDFKRLEAKLVEGMDFQLLLPYLQKHDVLTSAEADRLKSCEPPSERSKQLISLAISKGPVTLAGLLECFKESSKHKELAKLFETPGRCSAPDNLSRCLVPVYTRLLVYRCSAPDTTSPGALCLYILVV